MNIYKKPIIAFFAMIFIQTVSAFLVLIPAIVYQLIALSQSNINLAIANVAGPTFIAVALIVSSILTIIFMQYPLKMCSLKDSFRLPKMPVWKCAFLVIVAFLGIFATDVVSEILELPNIIEEDLVGMSSSFIGVLSVAFFGPLAEEVCFRGSIQQHMHNNGASPLRAIFVTSVLFGLIHMNPAQIPFAFIVGFIIGVFYWKTRSLVLPCIIHFLNNGLSCLLTVVYGDNLSFVGLLGGTASALCCAVASFALCAWALYRWAKEA